MVHGHGTCMAKTCTERSHAWQGHAWYGDVYGRAMHGRAMHGMASGLSGLTSAPLGMERLRRRSAIQTSTTFARYLGRRKKE